MRCEKRNGKIWLARRLFLRGVNDHYYYYDVVSDCQRNRIDFSLFFFCLTREQRVQGAADADDDKTTIGEKIIKLSFTTEIRRIQKRAPGIDVEIEQMDGQL